MPISTRSLDSNSKNCSFIIRRKGQVSIVALNVSRQRLPRAFATINIVRVSNQKRYDLAVAYRIYAGMSGTPPPVFQDSKLKLAEMCLRSFKKSLGNLKVKLWVILDKCPPEFENLFTELWLPEDLELLRFPGIGNQDTFAKQLEILTEQTAADFVYLAEDDYFYLPEKFHLALDLLKNNPDVDFCSLADHPDLHKDKFHQHKMRLKVEQGQVWRTANGTTCTFLTRAATLRETRATFMSYTKIRRWNVDATMWLSLTKHHVFNPYDLLAQPFIFPYRGGSLAFAWFYNWRQILFGRRYTLCIPMPSLAGHMDAGRMPPYVNWKHEFQKTDSFMII